MKSGIADFECKVVKNAKTGTVHYFWVPSFCHFARPFPLKPLRKTP
jgi:hypothetical protein